MISDEADAPFRFPGPEAVAGAGWILFRRDLFRREGQPWGGRERRGPGDLEPVQYLAKGDRMWYDKRTGKRGISDEKELSE